MAGGGDDRLSELPDDLIRRVLHFAPFKEAASTTSLSRRWRTPLWLSSGAVNLETHVEDYDYFNAFDSRRDAFVSAAAAALNATEAPVTRLTLRLESDCDAYVVANFLDNYTGSGRDDDRVVPRARSVLDVLLCHRAARRVEELKLVDDAECSCNAYYYGEGEGEIICDRVGRYKYTVSLYFLPWETLRELELTNCQGLYQWEAAPVVLPRLSCLRLRHCALPLRSLQRVIDAAPALTAVHLVSVIVDTTEEARRLHHRQHGCTPPVPRHRLRCPAATVMVLERCKWEEALPGSHAHGCDDVDRPVSLIALELDAPRLRRFRYKGLLRPFSFSPQPPELEQVDLHFFPNNDTSDKDPNRDLATFWRFARSFTSTKGMRLTVNHLEDIAVLSEGRWVELLPTFHRLERLEVRGVHRPKGESEAVAIANLLHCCPVLRDLRINLTTEHDDTSKDLDRKFRSDRHKSVPEGDVD